MYVPEYVVNHGLLSRMELHKLLQKAKVILFILWLFKYQLEKLASEISKRGLYVVILYVVIFLLVTVACQ